MVICVLGVFINLEGEHLPFKYRGKLDKVHPDVFHFRREKIKKEKPHRINTSYFKKTS